MITLSCLIRCFAAACCRVSSSRPRGPCPELARAQAHTNVNTTSHRNQSEGQRSPSTPGAALSKRQTRACPSEKACEAPGTNRGDKQQPKCRENERERERENARERISLKRETEHLERETQIFVQKGWIAQLLSGTWLPLAA